MTARNTLTALLLATLLVSAGHTSAQPVFPIDEQLRILSNYEHRLLLERDRLLAAERGMSAPVWLGSNVLTAQLIEADLVMEDVELLVLLGELVGIDDAIAANLNPIQAGILAVIGRERAIEGGLDAIRAQLLHASAANRTAILASLEQQLERVRSAFEQAQAARDARAEPVASGGAPACPTRYGDSFAMIANAGIPGYNNEVLRAVSLTDCEAACREREWCLSFDFEREPGTCYLQPVTSCAAPLNHAYPGNPYDHYYREALE